MDRQSRQYKITNKTLAINNSKTSLYADDTSIYLCSKDLSQLNKEINDISMINYVI